MIFQPRHRHYPILSGPLRYRLSNPCAAITIGTLQYGSAQITSPGDACELPSVSTAPIPDELLRALHNEAARRGVPPEQVMRELLAQAQADAGSPHPDEVRQLQSDLRRRTQELQIVVDNDPDPMSRFDSDLRYIFVNQANADAIGLRIDQIVGRTLRELGATEPRADLIESAIRRAFATGQPQRITFDFVTRKTRKYYDARLIPEFNDDGVIESVLAISQDVTAQRELEIQLRERETWYRGIVESQVDLVSRYTRDLTLVFVNDAYCRYYGGTPGSLVGHSILELEDPKVHQTIIDHVEEMVHDPSPRVNEILSYWPDGRERWIQWVTYAVQMEEGGATLFQAVGRDITTQRELERQLRESESWYRGMVESQIDLVSRHLPDTTLLFVNDAYCKFYGFKREELIGQSFLITEAPEVREPLLAKIWDEMHTPGPHISENLTIHPDGRERWVQWMSYAFADEDGKVTMIQAVGREITEQKLAERILRENEQRFRAMLEGASEGIALIDGQYRLVQINRYIEERFGYSREQLVEQPCGILIEEASRPSILGALQEARRSGESINMRLTPPPMARSSIGEAFPIEITFVPLTVSGEQMTMCLLVDITERQQLEEQRLINRALEVELEKERELIDLKQRFTTMVTHEFRTPLAIIQSTVNIVQNYFDRLPQDKLAERLDVVTKQAKRMSELLTDVLMYSRGERGLRPATLELIDLALFTRAIIDDLRTADNDAHPVTLSVNNPPVKLETDRRLLEHICLNLIGNAIKYSPPGSVVDVSISREGTDIVLKVRDRGIGIPAGDLPRIYDPFHRAANVGSRSGSGLGLPIVKQCVDALGGTINVDSNVGQGSTFTVRLPETAASG
jgi:PAS domain S-box-containing protein